MQFRFGLSRIILYGQPRKSCTVYLPLNYKYKHTLRRIIQVNTHAHTTFLKIFYLKINKKILIIFRFCTPFDMYSKVFY